MSKLIMRTSKIKTVGNVAGAGAHCSRARETPNANLSGPAPYYAVGSGDLAADVQRRITESGAATRKDSVLAVEILLTASPDYFDDASKTKQFANAALAFCRDEFGSDNVVSAVLHTDESTPHLHIHVVPIDETPRKRGPNVRLNAKKWFGGKQKMSKLQDRCYHHIRYKSACYLERGIRGSTAKHTTIKEWCGMLSQPLQPLPKVDKPPKLLLNTEKWALEQTEKIQSQLKPLVVAASLKDKAAEARERAEDLARSIEMREQQAARALESANKLREALDASADSEDELKRENDALRAQLEHTEQQLAQAQAQLSSLTDEQNEHQSFDV